MAGETSMILSPSSWLLVIKVEGDLQPDWTKITVVQFLDMMVLQVRPVEQQVGAADDPGEFLATACESDFSLLPTLGDGGHVELPVAGEAEGQSDVFQLLGFMLAPQQAALGRQLASLALPQPIGAKVAVALGGPLHRPGVKAGVR